MKKLLLTLAAIATFALTGAGQTNNSATNHTIKGAIEIRRGIKSASTTWEGGKDLYNLDVVVANTTQFKGTINDYPLVMGGLMGDTVKQNRKLVYDVDCNILNIRNPNVGRLFGSVPVTRDGKYRYDLGSLELNILPRANFGGSQDKFRGVTSGKPLIVPPDYLSKMKKDALSIVRNINGKKSTKVLKKYDKMEFSGHSLAAGPAPIYVSGVVAGEMVYEYDQKCWYLNNLSISTANSPMPERVAGNIRWYKNPASKGASEEGEYQFDIRLNEPLLTEAQLYSNTTATADESAFADAPITGPALTGTIVYKNNPDGASVATIDLTAQNMTKQQAMLLTKLFVFSMVVPLNND